MLKYFKLWGGKLRIFTRDENLDIAKGLGILFYRGVSGEIRGVITFLFRPGNR